LSKNESSSLGSGWKNLVDGIMNPIGDYRKCSPTLNNAFPVLGANDENYPNTEFVVYICVDGIRKLRLFYRNDINFAFNQWYKLVYIQNESVARVTVDDVILIEEASSALYTYDNVHVYSSQGIRNSMTTGKVKNFVFCT